MRKFASFAALTLCAGAAVAGSASTASAGITIGRDGPAPTAGTFDFANAWCGAPWTWSGPQSGTACTAQHDGAPGQ